MEWEGKSKRNAVTEGGAVFILGGQRPVDPEGCKGSGISILSQVCMICMIRGWGTRLMGGKGGDHAQKCVTAHTTSKIPHFTRSGMPRLP